LNKVDNRECIPQGLILKVGAMYILCHEMKTYRPKVINIQHVCANANALKEGVSPRMRIHALESKLL
jgi:hypothetical protein